MAFDKSYGLWEKKYMAGADGRANENDNIDNWIALMSHPVGKDSNKRMMHEHCYWTEVTASNDLVEGHSVKGQEYRSMVRIDVSPRGEAPEKLLNLLKDSGFEKRC